MSQADLAHPGWSDGQLGLDPLQVVTGEARAARGALGGGSPADRLVEIITVTDSRLHVSRVLQHAPSEGLLLFVDLERGKSNMGLASLRIGELAPAVLA